MRTRFLMFFALPVCTIALMFPPTALSGQADEQPQPPAAGSQPAQAATQPAAQSSTSKDRLLWTLPNFLTVENSVHVPPLSSRQKFEVTVRTSFDWAEFLYIGFLAGISQATDSELSYGPGAEGYFKRYGAYFADNTDENFWTAAILPSVLHQDPRYFQLGKGSFFHRVGYSVSRQFITRSDAGHRQFNFSEVAGSAISAGISNLYHPAEDRTFANTMSVWWTQVGWDSVASVVKEFWPDIRRKLSKHKAADPQP